MNSRDHWYSDLILLTCILGVFFLSLLSSHYLITPDEGRYCEVAREMVVSGDFITPKVNGILFFDKPILFYWLQAASIKLFGATELAVRLWPALFGLMGCLFTYVAGRLLFNRSTGILAALFLAVSPLYYFIAHYA